MASLTISVNESVLKRARTLAIKQGTSVNAVLREYLITYASKASVIEARRELAKLAKGSTSSSGKRGRTWTRDDLYER
jgi:hypothetical protein